MIKILAAIGEGIKKGIETVIGVGINQLIKFVELLKRVREAISGKLLIKLSSYTLEGYSQQLVGIEKGIKKLRDSLPYEKEIERIVNLAKTARTIPRKDLRDISAFINKISHEDIERIMTLAEVTKEIREILGVLSKTPVAIKDIDTMEKAVSISEKTERIPTNEHLKKEEERIKKMRERGLIDISDEEIKKVVMVLDYINTVPKEDLEKDLDVNIIKTIKKVVETFKLESLSEELLKELERDMHIIKWFLKSEGMNIGVAGPEFKKIEEMEEKETIDRKITLMEEEGIEDLTKLNIRLLFHIGYELLRKGEYGEAYENFNYITKINKNLKGVWLNKGIALGNMGKYDEEIKCYDQALKIDPDYARAWLNKGIALGSMGKYEEGTKCYDQALKIDADYARA